MIAWCSLFWGSQSNFYVRLKLQGAANHNAAIRRIY